MNKYRLERLRLNWSSPAFSLAAERLRYEADQAARISYEIRANEQGQWTHYYHCASDGAMLTFQWDQPCQHACPQCGKVYTGEPYNAAWVSLTHVQIGRAVYHLGLQSVVEPDNDRLSQIKDYLMAYADNYDTYAIHGNIPYNGPGRLFAQTLDEAHWITDLALGFDVIKESLSQEEAAHICKGLLEPCARFLIDYKENQIHNHAVLITSAVAALGLLLENEDIIQAGLTGEYGLLDQLERGIFEDGFWYEGNVHYHFYAFQSLLHYAMIAEGTSREIWTNRALKAMFDFPPELLLPSGWMPVLNDAASFSHIGTYAPYYEIAYAIYGDDAYRTYLLTAYGTWRNDEENRVQTWAQRDSIYALLFGEELPEQGKASLIVVMQTTKALPASGLTKLVNQAGWHVLVKHSRFGGEHDHMDRLGLSIMHGHVPLLIDPGTTAYGVPVHYGWFKHTYSHNTVSINGADQPPRDGRLIQLQEESWGVWLETAVDWLADDYHMKDRIILPAELNPWDADAYTGVQIRRINVLGEDHLLDVVQVTVPEAREVHWMNHVSGTRISSGNDQDWSATEVRLSRLDQHWFQMKQRLVQGAPCFVYQMSEGTLEQMTWCSLPTSIYTALTPDNPPSGLRTSLLIAAAVQKEVIFVQMLHYNRSDEEYLQGHLEVVRLPDSTLQVMWNKIDSHITYHVQLRNEKAELMRRRVE
ncbi:hypothetical protein A8709_24880 [Paenibacillus pectinilyticus]|uniref:Uncharacterized protein n=1 Tax=Paenibacillus pectinilyticus TaxID=512399 RepID=A0A1C1A8M2_9BACL|nr:heparinase II/III family protein [Paenibacillus pectinilyticus]OCT16950.1 hypothetical protein A8709_24880 [Paenibacillus pectinilyticus]